MCLTLSSGARGMARKANVCEAEHDEPDVSDELRRLEKAVSDKPNPAGLAGHVNVQGGVDVQVQVKVKVRYA